MSQGTNKKEYIKYSTLEKKEIEWLWYPYIPKGMVSIVQGDPKSGKTFMIIDIIARITRGDCMPLSENNFEQGKVILQNNDDPIQQTLLPRLEQQGALLDNVMFVDEEIKKLYFKDLKRLEDTIKGEKPLLVVIDPIQAFMGDADSNSMGQVRNTLMPLKNLAETYNCAIVLVQHLKKGAETKAIYKGAGSIDFVGFARSMLMVMKDVNNENERLLAHTCSNVAKEGHYLSYKITDKGLEWLIDKGDTNIDELINQDVNTKCEYAKNFILGCLSATDEISGVELSKLGKFGGYAERTFNEARSQLSKSALIDSIRKNNQILWSLKNRLHKVPSCNVDDKTEFSTNI